MTPIAHYVSRDERFHPGEVFDLGTLPGACAIENGRWLQPGDHITLMIDGVGQLQNRIPGNSGGSA